MVQWKLPLLNERAWLDAPGDSVPKSTEPSSMMTRWSSVSSFLNINCPPAATGTGLGLYDPLPSVPTMEIVNVVGLGLGVGLGLAGVDDDPPLHCDVARPVANTPTRIK